jgi:hypothetical protein
MLTRKFVRDSIGHLPYVKNTLAQILDKYPALSNEGLVVQVTNLNDALFVARDGYYRPLNGSACIYKNKYPAFLAPSGTIEADDEKITLGTALPINFVNGVWLYMDPSGTPNLTEGWVWADMESTTVGTLYADSNTLLSTINNSPSTTPLAFTVDGTFTGFTTAKTAVSFTIPAYALADRGTLEVRAVIVRGEDNPAATANCTITFDGTTISTVDLKHTASLEPTGYIHSLVKNSGTSRQMLLPTGLTGFGASTTSVTQLARDTATDLTFAVTLDTGNAADTVGIMSLEVFIHE